MRLSTHCLRITSRTLVLLLPVLLIGCMTVAEKERIETLPMYGQPSQQRPDFLIWEDNAFIRQETQRHSGDRRRAGRVWIERGMNDLRFGDIDGAVRHFNRAWLLDPDNYKVYWGFAQVLVVRGEYPAAADYLDRSLSLVKDPFQKPALLTDRGTVASLIAEGYSQQDPRHGDGFQAARRYFQAALELDSGYLPLWESWARACYREGAYAEAWKKIQQARRHGVERISPEFIRSLSEKLPQPLPVVGEGGSG